MSQQTTTTVKATAKPRMVNTPQGKVRAPRMQVTQADLDMYAVIVGRTPTLEEQTQALNPPEEVEETAEQQQVMESEASAPWLPSWSPVVLRSYLRGFSGGFKVNRPHIASWVYRVSAEARKRLQESQARLGPRA